MIAGKLGGLGFILRRSTVSERVFFWWATGIAVLLAVLYGWHTLSVPIVHDAEGYRVIAEDIRVNGIFSKFYMSDSRTYGYPWFLSLVWQLARAVGWPDRLAVFGMQAGLHFGAAVCLWLALQRAGVNRWAALAGYAAVVAHPFALLYPGYYLSESLSLSMGTFVLAGAIAGWGGRLPGWLWVVGGLVCGAMVMVRPANLFMVPVWGLVALVALRRREWWAVLGLVCVLIPWWPQFRNNQIYYGKSTPLVATGLVALLEKMGVMFLKYTTSIVPGGDPRVKYENPYFVDIEAGMLDPTDWYLRHPREGLTTWGIHVFALVDQDLPLPYVENLVPWYSPYVSGANWAMVALGLLTMGGAWRRRKELTAGEQGAVVLTGVLLGGHLGLHSWLMVEGRYGVAMLVPLYGLGAAGLVGWGRGASRKEWLAVGAVVLAVSAGGVAGSTWLQRQAPAIQSALVAEHPEVGNVVERLTGRRPVDALCHSPWSTWAMSTAGIGPEGEAILVSDGKQVSLVEYDVVVEPNREYTVEFEVQGEAGSTEELSVDLYGGGGYDHAEQNGVLRRHTGAYQPVKFTWNSGSDAPMGTRLRFASLARRPLRVRNVRFTGGDGAWAGWTMDNVRQGLGQDAVVCTPEGGVSVLAQGVALEKNTEYVVNFEVRGPAGKAQTLSIDLYAGAGYDHSEQNGLIESFSGVFEPKEFQWNSGPDAPERAELRFATLSQKPMQVRNVRFRKVGEE